MPHLGESKGIGFSDRGMNSSPMAISITRNVIKPKKSGNIRSSSVKKSSKGVIFKSK